MSRSRFMRIFVLISSLASSTALLSACYSPDITAVLYQCDRGRCPEGLYCNDGKLCTETTPGCKNQGGINLSPTTLVCPGKGNACAGEYAVCPPSMPAKTPAEFTPLCGKLAGDECVICCKGGTPP